MQLPRVLDDTFILSLAFVKLGVEKYAHQAAGLVRRWFLDPETAMTLHLDGTRSWRDRILRKGRSNALDDMNGLYYFLDAVRLLRPVGLLAEEEQERLGAYLRIYLSGYSPRRKDKRSARPRIAAVLLRSAGRCDRRLSRGLFAVKGHVA